MAAIGIGFVVVLTARELPTLPARAFSWWALGLHLLATVALFVSLKPLLAYSLAAPVWQGGLLWVALGSFYALSWLNCLVEPTYWWKLARQNWAWLVGGCLLTSITPFLTTIVNRTWQGSMVDATFRMATSLLSLVFDETVANPETVTMGVPEFQVEVGYLCSGFEGIGLIAIFLGCYLYLRRSDLVFPKALLILPLGMIASWLANGFRIAALVAVGVFISPEVAVGGFHSKAGWISFVVIGLFFVVLVEKFRLFHRPAAVAEGAPVGDLTALPFLAPLIAQLMLTLVFSAFSGDFDLLYPLRALLVIGVVWNYRGVYEAMGMLRTPTFAASGIGLLVYALWIGMVPVGEAADPRLTLTSQVATIWLMARLLGSVIVVPVIEELAFRGYLLRRLQSRFFDQVPVGSLTWLSVVVSSLAFGALHQAWLAGALAGVAYAAATKLRGCLSDAVASHAVTNLCIAVHVVAFERWDLWI